MKKLLIFPAVLMLSSMVLAAVEPVVDGKVTQGEYAASKSVLDGVATLSYSADGKGGIYVAISAKTSGWIGVGLGSKSMNGAQIYMGFVKDGTAVFSEQVGKAHRHNDVKQTTTDKSAVTLDKGNTTLEFHIPAEKMTVKGKSFPFIVAYSKSADLVSFHEDKYDSGTFTLN